jgi:excisionase family DNA binding protein
MNTVEVGSFTADQAVSPYQSQFFATSATRSDIRLLTVDQVAEILCVSPAWVRDHATRKQPRLKCVKVGKLLRFRMEDVEEFIGQWCQ